MSFVSYNIALSGMYAARQSLATVEHNIANVNTAGYSRQNVEQAAAVAFGTADGWFGRGADLSTVSRNYDAYLQTQVTNGESQVGLYTTYNEQVSYLDNLFGDENLALSTALDGFFKSVSDLATDPDDITRRSVMLSDANILVDRFQTLDGLLADTQTRVNSEVRDALPMINQYAHEIADLNDKIKMSLGQTSGQPPNDLMDRRDELVRLLNQEVNASVIKQDDQYNIFINGQALVLGRLAVTLTGEPSDEDPRRMEIYAGGQRIPSTQFTGGKLGALYAYRDEVLDPMRNQLGRIAIAMTQAFNEQHQLGQDRTGSLGEKFFNDPVIGQPIPVPNKNGVAPTGIPVVTLSDPAALTGADYFLRFDGTNWSMTNYTSGQSVTMTQVDTDLYTAEGLTINTAGITPPVAPDIDRWLLQPTRQAAGAIALAIDDPAKIAAALPTREVSGLNQIAFLNATALAGSGSFTLRLGADATHTVDLPIAIDTGVDSVSDIASRIADAINTNASLRRWGITADDSANDGTLGLFLGSAANARELYLTAGAATSGIGLLGITTAASNVTKAPEDLIGAGATDTLDLTQTLNAPTKVFDQRLGGDRASISQAVSELDFSGWSGLEGGTFTLRVGLDTSNFIDIPVELDGTEGSYDAVASRVRTQLQDAIDARGLPINVTIPLAAPNDGIVRLVPTEGDALLVTGLRASGALADNTLGNGYYGLGPGVTFTPPNNANYLNDVSFTVTAVTAGPPDTYDLRVQDPNATPALDTTITYDPATNPNISINGWTINLAGTPELGDTFTVDGLTGNVTDNRNANLLNGLETAKSMLNDANGEPTANFSDAFNFMVSQVATKTAEVKANATAQNTLLEQIKLRQQAISGVNLDEEAANLIRFQQAYGASAKSFEIASSLLDTLFAAIN